MPRARYTRDAEHFRVVTPFVYGDRTFATVGEPFPWRELGDGGLHEYKRRELWVSNKIEPCEAPAPDCLDCLGGFAALARIGAAFAGPPPPKPAKRPRAGA